MGQQCSIGLTFAKYWSKNHIILDSHGLKRMPWDNHRPDSSNPQTSAPTTFPSNFEDSSMDCEPHLSNKTTIYRTGSSDESSRDSGISSREHSNSAPTPKEMWQSSAMEVGMEGAKMPIDFSFLVLVSPFFCNSINKLCRRVSKPQNTDRRWAMPSNTLPPQHWRVRRK